MSEEVERSQTRQRRKVGQAAVGHPRAPGQIQLGDPPAVAERGEVAIAQLPPAGLGVGDEPDQPSDARALLEVRRVPRVTERWEADLAHDEEEAMTSCPQPPAPMGESSDMVRQVMV